MTICSCIWELPNVKRRNRLLRIVQADLAPCRLTGWMICSLQCGIALRSLSKTHSCVRAEATFRMTKASSTTRLELSEDQIAQLLSGNSNRRTANHSTNQDDSKAGRTASEQSHVRDFQVVDKRIRIDKMSTQDSPHILNERSIREGARPVVVSIPDAHNASDWQINLERDGDIIRVIHVACSCGEQLSIQCDYSSTKK